MFGVPVEPDSVPHSQSNFEAASMPPMFGVQHPLPNFRAAPPNGGATPQNFGAAPHNFGVAQHTFGAAPHNFGATPHNFEAAPHNCGAAPQYFGATPHNFGAAPPNFGAATASFGAAPPNFMPPGFVPMGPAFANMQEEYLRLNTLCQMQMQLAAAAKQAAQAAAVEVMEARAAAEAPTSCLEITEEKVFSLPGSCTSGGGEGPKITYRRITKTVPPSPQPPVYISPPFESPEPDRPDTYWAETDFHVPHHHHHQEHEPHIHLSPPFEPRPWTVPQEEPENDPVSEHHSPSVESRRIVESPRTVESRRIVESPRTVESPRNVDSPVSSDSPVFVMEIPPPPPLPQDVSSTPQPLCLKRSFDTSKTSSCESSASRPCEPSARHSSKPQKQHSSGPSQAKRMRNLQSNETSGPCPVVPQEPLSCRTPNPAHVSVPPPAHSSTPRPAQMNVTPPTLSKRPFLVPTSGEPRKASPVHPRTPASMHHSAYVYPRAPTSVHQTSPAPERAVCTAVLTFLIQAAPTPIPHESPTSVRHAVPTSMIHTRAPTPVLKTVPKPERHAAPIRPSGKPWEFMKRHRELFSPEHLSREPPIKEDKDRSNKPQNLGREEPPKRTTIWRQNRSTHDQLRETKTPPQKAQKEN